MYLVNFLPRPPSDLILLERPHQGRPSAWSGSPEHIIKAAQGYVSRSGQPLEGYAEHSGNEQDPAYPKYDDNGNQISGAAEASLDDALAWFGHDLCEFATYSFEDIREAPLDQLDPAVLEVAVDLGWLTEEAEEAQ